MCAAAGKPPRVAQQQRHPRQCLGLRFMPYVGWPGIQGIEGLLLRCIACSAGMEDERASKAHRSWHASCSKSQGMYTLPMGQAQCMHSTTPLPSARQKKKKLLTGSPRRDTAFSTSLASTPPSTALTCAPAGLPFVPCLLFEWPTCPACTASSARQKAPPKCQSFWHGRQGCRDMLT